NFLWPYDRNERKKARPKFYFFDCGVLRALQQRLNDKPTPAEKGFLFETWFYGELCKIRDYQSKDHEIGFWRSGNHEVDFVISSGRGPILAMECKSSSQFLTQATWQAFQKKFPKVPLVIASAVEKKKRKLNNGLMIYPWKEALNFYKNF
ncbi:MAG: DUF4143 domain-containing protein, partial [Deltaproteobacteria bacterium]|nr:DUF4143 domain-containing protein [Deltaproteobacteria bacterium]